MKENKITVIINKPIGEVFEFTTNPKNTHLWIPSIEEEIAEEYPPKIIPILILLTCSRFSSSI